MIRFRISTDRYQEMITACNDWIILEYFEGIQKNLLYLLLLPFFLCFLIIYGVYLLFYGLLVAILWIQEYKLLDIISDIDNGFLRIPLYIIAFPIQIVLYIYSTIFPLPVLICLLVFYGILFLIQLPFSALKNTRMQSNIIEQLKYL